MAGKGVIEHKGRIDHIEGNNAFVKIHAESACISCKLNGVCGTSDTKEKIIEVSNVGKSFQQGDEVDVQITEKMGMKALFYGYLLPFLVVIVTLLTVNAITGRQGLSGLIALFTLAPYYLILALFKSRLKKSFQFNLHKRMQ